MIVLASFLFARLETLPLALQDFMPVAATAAGCWFLARFVRRVRPEFAQVALVGAASVVAGGASKAVWKLIRALNGPDFKWLDAALFPFLAWGFALLAWALIHVDYTETGGTPRPLGAWKVPVGLSAGLSVLAFASSAATDWSRAWVIPMIALMTLADLSVIVLGVNAARRRAQMPAAVLLILNFVTVLGLTRLASVDQTRGLQWIEQLGNTAGNGAFAVAWWIIERTRLGAVKTRPDKRGGK